jgi:drug/metabolite transporter (DMT)-like permease
VAPALVVTAHSRALLQTHFCVLVWGFTAILGRVITLPATPLVIWRMILVSAVLAAVPRVRHAVVAMSARRLLAYTGVGAVIALHWVTFYTAVKMSNASVAATTMALAPVFLAFVEPFLFRRRFDPHELLFGLAVVPGVALVVGGVPATMRTGFAFGVVSAFLAGLFNSLNKRLITDADALSVTFVELTAGMLLLVAVSAMLPHQGPLVPIPDLRDGALLLVFATVCTVLPFALSLVALRQLSAFSVQLATNLEPVYALVFGIVLLGEQRELDRRFYLGVVVLLAAVFAHPLLVKPKGDRQVV